MTVSIPSSISIEASDTGDKVYKFVNEKTNIQTIEQAQFEINRLVEQKNEIVKIYQDNLADITQKISAATDLLNYMQSCIDSIAQPEVEAKLEAVKIEAAKQLIIDNPGVIIPESKLG